MAGIRGQRKQRQMEKRMATGGGKLFGYVRVSTQEQGTNGHSLAGQYHRLREASEKAGFELADIEADVMSGAKRREKLEDLWDRVRAGEAEGIIFPKLDRLGRSQLHLAALVEQARDEGLTLFSADEGMQVNRGRLVNEALPFLVALAQVERERISRRTKEGLAAARRAGWPNDPPGRRAENVGDVADRATRLRRDGKNLREIAALFNAEGLRTARGTEFRANTVWRMVERVDQSANLEIHFPGKELAAAA